MAADEFRAKQPVAGELLARAHGKGAGAGRLAGHVDGDSQALAETKRSAAFEDCLLLTSERHQAREVAPTKGGARSPAREVNRVMGDKFAPDKFSHPLGWVVVDPKIIARGASQAGVVKESEIIKSQLL